MLFTGRLGSVRHKLGHFFAAAHHRYTLILDKGNDVPAMQAFKKTLFHGQPSFLRAFAPFPF